MKTRDEAEEKSVEMVLSSLPDHPKSYLEGFRDCFDWLNESEQSEPEELTADDFVGITATNLCVGCYFFEQNKNCPNWRECDGIIYKLKEAKQ